MGESNLEGAGVRVGGVGEGGGGVQGEVGSVHGVPSWDEAVQVGGVGEGSGRVQGEVVDVHVVPSGNNVTFFTS